jgi:hypothetical protein
MQTVSIKKDEKTGESYFDLDEISHLFEDPKAISYYEIQELDKGSISIVFYDSNKNVIPVKKLEDK